jgi:ribosomal protein L4
MEAVLWHWRDNNISCAAALAWWLLAVDLQAALVMAEFTCASCRLTVHCCCCCCRRVQVYDVLNADVIVMEKSALQAINSAYGAAESSA